MREIKRQVIENKFCQAEEYDGGGDLVGPLLQKEVEGFGIFLMGDGGV